MCVCVCVRVYINTLKRRGVIRGVMVIVVENGRDNPISNPDRDCLTFTLL